MCEGLSELRHTRHPPPHTHASILRPHTQPHESTRYTTQHTNTPTPPPKNNTTQPLQVLFGLFEHAVVPILNNWDAPLCYLGPDTSALLQAFVAEVPEEECASFIVFLLSQDEVPVPAIRFRWSLLYSSLLSTLRTPRTGSMLHYAARHSTTLHCTARLRFTL